MASAAKNNGHLKQQVLRQGQHFGEISLIYKCQTTASVIALKYCMVGKLLQKDFNDIITEHPMILKFLKDNADLLPNGFGSSDHSGSSDDEEDLRIDRIEGFNGNGVGTGKETRIRTCWVTISCLDRPSLLADISNVISRYNQNILSYEGRRVEKGDRKFVMKFQLEGPTHLCGPLLVDGVAQVQSVLDYTAWCDL